MVSPDVFAADPPYDRRHPPGALVISPLLCVSTATDAAVSRATPLTLQPPTGNYVASLSVTPQFIVGGTVATGAITLASASTSNSGSVVQLSSSDPSLIVPSSVTVRKNRTSETFPISTSVVTEPRHVVLTASFGNVVQRLTAIVAPENTITLVSLGITPQRVVGGASVTGIVTLSAVAPLGGATVSLTASRRNMLTVPETITITEGATSATFLIGTDVVHGNRDRAVDIEATYNSSIRTTTLTLAPEGSAMRNAPSVQCASLSPVVCAATVATTATPTPRAERYFVYTPELNLLAESEESLIDAKLIRYSYVWFGGQPLAQIDHGTNELAFYANDHLGTPILQTDHAGNILWQAEREPYGRSAIRRAGGGRHQPLAFPGQEEESATEQSYNIFRWYRAGWGRYTQSDPLLNPSFTSILDLVMGEEAPTPDYGSYGWYSYSSGSPINRADDLGLKDYAHCTSTGDIIKQSRFAGMVFMHGVQHKKFIIARRWCNFRCYCEKPDNCYKIPCLNFFCEKDHGTSIRLNIFDKEGVRPCASHVAAARKKGKC